MVQSIFYTATRLPFISKTYFMPTAASGRPKAIRSTRLHTPSVSQQRVLMQCLGNRPYRITAFCSPLCMWTACDKWANCGSGYSQVRHLLPSWHREPGKRLPTLVCASILMGPKSGVASSVWLAGVLVKTFISPSGC